MDNGAGEMMVFVRGVGAESLSEAARAMLMTPWTVSKLIAGLEARIGARLIEQSTWRLVLTSEGQFYYGRSRSRVSQIDETEQQVKGDAKPEGLIRVSSSVTFGSAALEPILAAFLEAYPGVVVDLSLSDEMVGLYLDRTDFAIRVGSLPDSTLMARKIGETRRWIVASPAYLERRRTRRTPEDLTAPFRQ